MELELEGNLVLERPPTRRWIAIIAVVVPVVACVCSVAWFIRAFIAPPVANISTQMQLAAAQPSLLAPVRAEVPAPAPEPEPPQQTAMNEPAAPAASPAAAEKPASLPMFGSLSAAPPFENSAAFANPAHDTAAPMTAPPMAVPPMDGQPSGNEQTAMLEPATPIAGPIPIPHPKPHFSVATITGPVPLPRPRPAENPPSDVPDLPAFDRHAVD
jgi:hypothetical protein